MKSMNLLEHGIKPNVENINKVIDAIKNEDTVFTMVSFSLSRRDLVEHNIGRDKEAWLPDHVWEQVEKAFANNKNICDTPACICGWSNHIRLAEKGAVPKDDVEFGKQLSAAKWLGLLPEEGISHWSGYARFYRHLFMTEVEDQREIRLSEITRDMAIYQLEQIRDEGVLHYWHDVIERFRDLGHG
ncbi:hypothetical protein [Rhizobium phage RHEph12]|nr:hypothetical protein [Rhizobium phage RHEph12]